MNSMMQILLTGALAILTAIYVWLTHRILTVQQRREELNEYDRHLLIIKK